jgi:hypothetical protein
VFQIRRTLRTPFLLSERSNGNLFSLRRLPAHSLAHHNLDWPTGRTGKEEMSSSGCRLRLTKNEFQIAIFPHLHFIVWSHLDIELCTRGVTPSSNLRIARSRRTTPATIRIRQVVPTNMVHLDILLAITEHQDLRRRHRHHP